MIMLQNIAKHFGNNLVLNNINLKIKTGENIAIVGANGAGKTTLVEIICGIQKPSKGSVIWTSNIEPSIGMQFQEGVWPQKVRAIDLIKFFKGNHWQDDAYVDDIFKIFEIEPILRREINKLSVGQKQRLNCFLAIINNPELIIMDELITGLDLKMQIRILNYFKQIKLAQDKTLLIVSHIPDEIEELTDRIIILKDGIIYQDIQLVEVLEKFKNVRTYIENYFAEVEINHTIKGLKHEVNK